MSANARPYTASDEKLLMVELWDPKITDDPYNFVMYAYPWGKKGTPLENKKGPRKWQVKRLKRIAAHIAENRRLISLNKTPKIYKLAVVSGRGTGKSALVAWLIHWMMSCHIGSTTVVAANSEAQLKDKTWAELGKWLTLAINQHWFEKNAMSVKPAPWFEESLKNQLKIDTGYYYANAQLWSEEKPDSFAGVHNHNGILVIFDEASGIPKPIWTVTSGFFTEPTPFRFWLVFSNGRRNTGSFFECFHKDRAEWDREHLNSLEVEGIDTSELLSIIRQNGEDSDEARTEVLGQFPRQGAKQFISRDIVSQATEREIIDDSWAPLIMGVDPARYGDDSTVICFRQGRNQRIIPTIKLKGKDNMEVANQCAHLITKYNPDGVCIDSGNGTGIIDRLKEMGYKVFEIGFGTKSPEPQWLNNRTYMWAQMRDWLGGGCLDPDQDLIDDLTSPEYKFVKGGDVQRLETKEELKSRGFASPDYADALACTFAVKIARKDTTLHRGSRKARVAAGVDSNPWGW